MPSSSDLQQLNLAGLRQRCAEESERFFRRLLHDPAYCYELFRRALAERSAQAWEFIYAQYRPLVAGWVRRHPAFAASGEEVAYFANRAFERLYTALTPAKFSRLPNLKAVLRYLQMCVHSALVDQGRAQGLAAFDLPLEALEAAGQPHAAPVEAQVFDSARRQALWDWLAARLHNERERQVVYGSFVLDLKPGELHQVFNGLFSSVDEVYRVKQNLLERLRRDPEFAQFWGDA